VLLDLGEIIGSSFFTADLYLLSFWHKVLRAGTEVKAASVPHVASAPEEGKASELVQGLLCAGHSFKNLPETCMEGSEGPVWGKVLEGPRIFHMHCVHALHTCISACIARLRSTLRSVAALAGTSIQTLAELGQWRAAACAGCWNGDGLLVQRSIGNDHAVGNDE
jgi:hypothetical protein